MSQAAPSLRQRRPLLILVLVACFVIVPIAEIWLLSEVSSAIGLGPTVAILLVEAIFGGWLLRNQGTRSWRALTEAMGAGRIPTGHLADAALVLAGGLLFMLPGFFTDIFGLLCLLPWTRPAVRKFLGFVLAKQASRHGVDVRSSVPGGQGTVIRGETVDDPAPQPPSPARQPPSEPPAIED